MSCIPGLCTSYIAEAFRGVHSDDDRYMLALYTDKADITCDLQKYTTKGEASGAGYTAGGVLLHGFEVIEDGNAVVITFADAQFGPRTTIEGVIGGLVYNASKGNRAVGVIALSKRSSSQNGPFDVLFPEPTAGAGVFVIN